MKKITALLLFIFITFIVMIPSNTKAADIPDTIYCGSVTESFNLDIPMFNEDKLEDITVNVFGNSINQGLITKVNEEYVITFDVINTGDSSIIISDIYGNNFYRNISVVVVTNISISETTNNTFIMEINDQSNVVGEVVWNLDGEDLVSSSNIVTTDADKISVTYNDIEETFRKPIDLGLYGNTIVNGVGILLLFIILFLMAKRVLGKNIYNRMRKDVEKNHKLIIYTKENLNNINKKLPKEVARGIVYSMQLNNNTGILKSNYPEKSQKLFSYVNEVVKSYKALNSLFDNLSNKDLISILDYIDSYTEKISLEITSIEEFQHKKNVLKDSLKTNRSNNNTSNIKEIKSEEEIEAFNYIKSLKILK